MPNQSPHHLLHFQLLNSTLVLISLVPQSIKLLLEIFRIFLLLDLISLLRWINSHSLCISLLRITGLLSSTFFSIFMAHLIMVWFFIATPPSLFMAFLLQIRMAIKMTSLLQVLTSSTLVTILWSFKKQQTVVSSYIYWIVLGMFISTKLGVYVL